MSDDVFFESKSFDNLQVGTHLCTLKVRLDDIGDPLIETTAKGPRAKYRIVNGDGASALIGQTFNKISRGVIAGHNASLGFSDAAILELTENGKGWTDTDAPLEHVLKIGAMWESSEGFYAKTEESEALDADGKPYLNTEIFRKK